jgi:hypothetical protein
VQQELEESNLDHDNSYYSDDYVKLPAHISKHIYIASISTEDTELDMDRALMDSGAAISLSHPSIARKFSLPMYDLPKMITLEFANGTLETCHKYANFGSIFGRVIICEAVKRTLISTVQLSKRRIECSTSFKKFIMKDSNGVEIISSDIDYNVGLPTVDIEEVLRTDTSKFVITNYPPAATSLNKHQINGEWMNKLAKRAKLPRVTKEEFMEVIRLHERMNHMASHIMAMAIRNEAWTGALIPAATIERVFTQTL